jgi:glycosyltransferase involved in cell wall biosynthesis
MKILFITRLFYPHIGGVEKHVYEVSKKLKIKGNIVKIISEQDVKQPHIKLFGLIYIWLWLFNNRILIKNADVIHCHDVFIWYLPFRFLYPKKPLFTTFHGWEEKFPIPRLNIIQKRLAAKLSNSTIAVGRYIKKYYGFTANKITHGAAEQTRVTLNKKTKSIVYVGRLEENTGILEFLECLNDNNGYKVDFCGDGSLRKECEKYGTVHGFTNPNPYLKKAEYCVPGGYLAALEGLSYGCKLKLFWNNKIKEDYWKMSPFYELKGEKLKKWAKKQTWNKLADEYLDLYNHIK